jgi:uncharacterized protein
MPYPIPRWTILGLLLLPAAVSAEADPLALSCANKDYESCAHLGSHYQWGTEGRPQDHDRALEYYALACEGRSGTGCFGVGMLLNDRSNGDSHEKAKALEYLKRGCELGNEYACGLREALE